MKVKINEKLICIPPHISTTWEQVSFLRAEENPEDNGLILVLHLTDGKIIKIPNLDTSLIDIAFAAHLRYLETSSNSRASDTQSKSPQNMIQSLLGIPADQIGGIPLRFGISGFPGGMEGLEMAFQHNPSQSNAPNLPPEIIEKITTVAKLVSNGDLTGFPKPEPHCNCMHCQVARAIHGTPFEKETVTVEEVVSDEDLRFRSWDITQVGEKLYSLTNPLDPREHYTVFLGSPVGCTCGHSHCEHIRSVLSS